MTQVVFALAEWAVLFIAGRWMLEHFTDWRR